MQDQYHLLIESIKDYSIFMLDTAGRVVSWNVGATAMKGYTEEEIIGKHFSIFFLPEDVEKGKPANELKVALRKGRYEEEGWRVKKDGSKFAANIIITPMFSETKEHIGFAKITRDLTEKKRSEELYHLLVNQVKEYAIFMLDTTGKILTWNEGAERIKGYSAYEIINKHFSIFYTAEDKAADKPAKELEIAIRVGKYEEEGLRVKKDGSLFYANVVITPIYTDRHIGFAKVTRDLTKRKELEKLQRANLILETTNKELERFAFTASHDLKAPLRKISMYANIVISDKNCPVSESNDQYLRKILSASQRMDAMIEDILDYSVLSNKQQFEAFSLKEIFTDTMELLEETINEKNASIHADDLPTAIIIPSQMRQLFQNLVSNSIKFSKKDVPCEIRIQHQFINKEHVNEESLWPADQYLLVDFIDNGIGFKQEYAEKIFNLFDRLHPRSTYEGSGLGLAICRKIAENHGGHLSAKSEVGNGASFRLILPA